MIISEEKVRSGAREIRGISPADVIVKAVCRRVEAMLKSDMTEEEQECYGEAVSYLAVLLAVRDMAAAGGAPLELKTGDLSVKNPEGTKELDRLIEDCIEDVAPILRGRKAEFFGAVEWRNNYV